MAEDFNKSLSRLRQDTASLDADLQKAAQAARSLGDLTTANLIEEQRRVASASGTPRAAQDLTKENELRREGNALTEQGTAEELRRLEVIERQNAALQEQAALQVQRAASLLGYTQPVPSGPAPAAAQSARVQEAARQAEYAAQLEQQTQARAMAMAQRQQGYFGIGQAQAAGVPPDVRDVGRAQAPLGNLGALTAEEKATQELARTTGAYSVNARNAGLSSQALTRDMTMLGAAQAEASSQMRRHGALTTEFLSALARGEVTVQEFGYQLGATASKFAGWTAAAAATFGLIGALSEVTKGAKESSSGIDQLRRSLPNINAGEAAQGFRDVSREVNVSISDVANAQFYAARAFQSQGESLKVASTALKAYVLDNVDAQDAVKSFAALNVSFGSNAQGVANVFDRLDVGQQKFNARLNQTLPILGRAAPSIKNAGGDLNQLIDQIITLTRAQPGGGTGGGNPSTFFIREPSNLAKPAAEAILKQYGFDPEYARTHITQFNEDVIQWAKHQSPDVVRQMANALGGGTALGGRYGVPLLNSADLLAKVQGKTANAGGSADEDLSHLLDQVNKQITAIGNGLQRIGSALAESGAFFGLGVALHLLNSGLGDVEKLIDTFDRLDPTLRTIITSLIEIRALMLFTQRTQIGSTFADLTGLSRVSGFGQRQLGNVPGGNFLNQTFGGFGTSPVQAARQSQVIGTRAVITAIDRQIEGTAEAMNVMGTSLGKMAVQADRINAEMKLNVDNDEVYSQLLTEHEALMNQIKAKQDEINAQAALQNDLVAAQNRMETQLAGLQRRPGQKGYISDATVAANAAGTEGGAKLEEGVNAGAQSGAEKMAAGVEEGGTAAAGRMSGGIKTAGEYAAASIAEAFKVGGKAAAEEVGVGVAAGGAGAGALSTSERVRGALPSFGEVFQGAMIAFFGSQAAQFVGGKVGGSAGSAIGDLGKAGAYGAGIGSVIGPIGTGAGFLAGITADLAWRAGGQIANTLGVGAQTPVAAGQSPAFQDAYSKLFGGLNSEIGRLAAGKLDPKQVQQLQETLHNMATDPAYAQFTQSIKGMSDAITVANNTPAARRARNTQVGADQFAQFAILAGEGAKQVSQDIQASLDKADVLGASNQDINDAVARLQGLATQYHDSHSLDGLKALKDAQGALITMATKDAQKWIDAADSTTDPTAKEGDYRRAIASTQNYINRLNSGYNKQAADIHALSAQRSQLEQSGLKIYDPQTGGSFNSNQTSIDALSKRIDADKKVLAVIKRATDSAEAGLLKLNEQQKEQLYTTFTTAGASNLAVANASTQDKLAQLQNTLGQDNRNLALAAQLFTKRSSQYKDAYAKALQDQQAVVDEQRSRLDASNKLATASIQTLGPEGDLSRQRSDLAGDYRVLAFDQAHHADPGTIQNDLATIDDARRAVAQSMVSDAQQAHQNAQAYIDARRAYAASLTNDPIASARDQLNADIQSLALIKPGDYQTHQQYQTAVLNQKAKINDDRKNLSQQIVSTDMSTLDFELHIQQIGDAQYIDGLRKLLKLKNLSLADRQSILTKIYDLQHQSSNVSDFNVGNIAIPSVYEIRRAIGQSRTGAAAGQAHTVINHTSTINIDARGGNVKHAVNELGKALDKHLHTSVRAKARARGVI